MSLANLTRLQQLHSLQILLNFEKKALAKVSGGHPSLEQSRQRSFDKMLDVLDKAASLLSGQTLAEDRAAKIRTQIVQQVAQSDTFLSSELSQSVGKLLETSKAEESARDTLCRVFRIALTKEFIWQPDQSKRQSSLVTQASGGLQIKFDFGKKAD